MWLQVELLYHVRHNYDLVIVFIWKLSMRKWDIAACQVDKGWTYDGCSWLSTWPHLKLTNTKTIRYTYEGFSFFYWIVWDGTINLECQPHIKYMKEGNSCSLLACHHYYCQVHSFTGTKAYVLKILAYTEDLLRLDIQSHGSNNY